MVKVNVIGGGLAGSECAYLLAKNGINVTLYEMKPHKKSEAHKSNNLGELVCSNSLKSKSITNACGLLKEEMRNFGSLMLEAANVSQVDAGQALAVDREKFSLYIIEKIKGLKNIQIVNEEVTSLDKFLKSGNITVIATGPLTSEKLSKYLKNAISEENLYFYDAEAPIIDAESIDMNVAYAMDRYGKLGEGDYLNLPMNKEEYYAFYNELVNAECANRHDFDKLLLFEGCMPIEEMAKRGEKTLTFGTLKPVGLEKDGKRSYAVVQLRPEDKEKKAYNLVGFQTSLKFGEQERVFRMIPGLQNAIFLRYGVMHKNTYINGGRLLNRNFSLKNMDNVYFAGQISGVEGYVESAASGMIVALDIISKVNGEILELGEETMLGSLSKYVSTENEDYQPMNANFGIIKKIENGPRSKKEKYELYAKRSLKKIKDIRERMSYLK